MGEEKGNEWVYCLVKERRREEVCCLLVERRREEVSYHLAVDWKGRGEDKEGRGEDKEGRGEEPPCSVERTRKMCVAIYSLVPRLILIPLFGMGRSLGTRLVHILL